MENNIIRFTVGNTEHSNESLHITIPCVYAPLFEGKHFRDMHHLSMALMFASCAAEARYYDEPLNQKRNEKSLRSALGI